MRDTGLLMYLSLGLGDLYIRLILIYINIIDLHIQDLEEILII